MNKEELKISLIEQFKDVNSQIRAIMLKTNEAETNLDNSSFLKHKCFQSWEHRLRIDIESIKNQLEYSFQINFSEAEFDGYPEVCDEINQYSGMVYYKEHFRIKGNRLAFRLKKCLLSQDNYQFSLDMSSQEAKRIKSEDYHCIYDCDTGELSGDLKPSEFYYLALNARYSSINNSSGEGVVPYMDFGFSEKLLESLNALSDECKDKEISSYIKSLLKAFKNKNGIPMPGDSVSPMLFMMLTLFSKAQY